MKRVMLAILLIFLGCSKQTTPNQQYECQRDGVKAPIWVCQPTELKDAITAIGIAKPNLADDEQMQLDEAMAAARDSLARRIEVKVKNMFKQFKAITGYGKNQTYEKATENVSKQVAYKTLRNSRLLKSWKSPSGTLYVLVGMPKEDVVNNIKTSLKNNEALYQKFLAKKAQEELEKEIEKEFKQ